MKKVKIALLGLGNVGTGVCKILNTNKEEIRNRAGYDIEIAKILVRDVNKKRDVNVPEGVITASPEEILDDESIKIVVEVMGGTDPAKDYMIRAMKAKKHVVTANKLAIATLGDELIGTAKEEGVMLKYEASVAGGIPIIDTINESLTANKIKEIVGIINGTTNYILTKMYLENMDFETALKEAQEMGYAEADPTSDVEGYDAVYKLGILTSLAFGTKVDSDLIYREGISNIKSIDIEYAKEFGYVIKLLAIVKEIDNVLELRVHPTMISTRHPLANVNDSFNAVLLKGNAVGDLMLYGRGAGDLPTGSAVVGDIISILKDNMEIKNEVNKIELSAKQINNMENTESQYYIRATVKDVPGVLGEISAILGNNNVSVLSVIQKSKGQEFVTIVFVTHKTLEGNINKSISAIEQLSSVQKIENVIRVENGIK
ncbi:homoserine dehydrogenase [Clostridium ganghwense]|uniref:Homoserine dehydrogenase n=1 Tax=Clostridium ganghwense TaxID=312089 RepID=A0ABT4CST8_9CLOT|nr:homoserine dehydrogenase [Clostridium ganghwense]MCY6372150.1 homoserine dehydrogenase [Clostridium ganghwense]